jgi:2-alkyl-3-oxoalkanoate reductase
MRVFVAGAGGAIGRRLVPQLVERGHEVVASSRSREKFDSLRALGTEPVVMDGLNALEVGAAVARAEPDAVVHQMTALARMGNLRRFDKEFAVTNELRTKGTDYLLAAAAASGVRRIVAQSYTGWPNIREGGPVKTEEDPLDPHPTAQQTESLAAIRHLERAVLEAPLEGVVLRYGSFYGPGASEPLVELVEKRKLPIVGSGSGIWSWIHIDDAAAATVAALESRTTGIYNVVDDDPAPVSEWLPYFAEVVGAKPPRHVPVWLARLAAGEVRVSAMTQSAARRTQRRSASWAGSQGGRRGVMGSATGSPAKVCN